MMNLIKKLSIIANIMLFCTAAVFGQSPSSNPEKTPAPKLNNFTPVNGNENWDYTYDVSGLSKGTYNLIVQGIDKAGNIIYSNSVNVLIDPESDLPQIVITNPVADMRVGNNLLNIVGTCLDDDAVAKVEVAIDDSEFKPAEGTDFWSYKLSTTGMQDGKHTIRVRGIDINGTTGPIVSRSFHLDTRKPLNQITSFQSGIILSGAKIFQGYTEDLNGILALSYSIDNGKSFQPLALNYNDKEKKYFFSLSIDTTKIPDGPAVLWLKSRDGQGSVGISAFLFFVDNKKPSLEVLAPKPDAKMNGKFYVVGRVQDELGIKSLSYQHRNTKADIPLIPGNPYWYVELDTTGLPSGTEVVKFTVEDIAGNVIQQEVKIQIDSSLDKPVVSLAWPKPDIPLSPPFEIYGFADDDDSVAEVVVKLDSQAEQTLACQDGFVLPVESLDPGKHTITVYAVDINKVKGDPITVNFTVPGLQPVIRLESLLVKGSPTPFLPGIEVNRLDKAVIRGRISNAENIKKLRLSLAGGPEQDLGLRTTSQKSVAEFDISLPETIPYGIVEIRLTATDTQGQTLNYASFIHVTNFSKISVKPGIYFADVRLESQPIPLAEEFPFQAFFVGDRIRNATMEPSSSLIRLSENNGQLTIIPTGQFDLLSAKLKVTTVNGEIFITDLLSFTTTSEYFNNPLTRLRLQNILTKSGSQPFYPGVAFASHDGQTKLEGKAASEIAKIEYSFNNKDFRAADYKRNKNEPESSFSLLLPSNLSYGYNELYLKSYDEKNKSVSLKTFFFKTDASSSGNDEAGLYFLDARTLLGNEINLTLDTPFIGYVNGRDIKSASLKPASPFLKVTFSGKNVVIEATAEGKSGPTTVEVVTENNQTYTSGPYIFQSNAIPPQLTITSPQPGTWVNQTVNISGRVNESTGIKSFEYALQTPTDWIKIPLTADKGDLPFNFKVDLSSIEDGKVAIFIKAVDTGDNESLKLVTVKKDTSAPLINQITPETEMKVNGVFSVTGLIEEKGRLKTLEFSSDGKNYQPVLGLPIFAYNLDITQFKTLPDKYYVKATDEAGNSTVFNPNFKIDFQADKPRVEIQLPLKGEVIRSDFIISGMAFDDDGVRAIYYRLDGKEFVKLENAQNSFSIPISLDSITDNEHKIEVYAEDMNGLKGDIAGSNFFISKAEPVASLTSPTIDVTARGEIQLTGTASDANGIKAVYLSFDNGNTYHLATGKEKFSYQFNTKILADGIHRLLIKAVDNTDTEGLSATLINIDNTPPQLSLDRPGEGESVSEALVLSGRAFDNIQLVSLTVNLAPVNQANPSDAAGQTYNLTLTGSGGVFSRSIDTSKLKEGWYNVRLEARDRANNITYVTRNIRVEQKKLTNRVEQIFPLDGESVSGYFTISGRVIAEIPVVSLSYALDDKEVGAVEVNANKYFALTLGPETISDGEHTISFTAKLDDGSIVVSAKRRITYIATGPWIKISNFNTGDFISRRPWLKGESGYYLPEPSREDREAYAKYERERESNRIVKIEISFNNGKSFSEIGGSTNWSYRLQTQDIPDGEVRILIRATTASQKTALARLLVVNDDLPPLVRILLPEENQRFNDKIKVLGIATDENGLSSIQIALRPGDKAAYKVPEFIQGMYLDGQFRSDFVSGVSWAAGLGFSFFEQNVKLQAQVGYVPSERFGGLYLGAKLLANIFKLPFEAIFGPDADFMSASLALGVNVSYCTNTEYEIAFSENGLVLAAVLAQLEFIKFSLLGATAFNGYSFYTEFQVWLLSSDVVGVPVVEMRLAFGARIQLF